MKIRMFVNEKEEMEHLRAEFEKLKAELAEKNAALETLREKFRDHEAAMDEERRALIFMLEDVNESTEEMEKALKNLKAEKEVTDHLLILSEVTAHATDLDRLMEAVVRSSRDIIGCDICLSYLWDNASRVFRPCKAGGLGPGMIALFMTGPLDERTGWVKRVMGERMVQERGSEGLSWLVGIDSLIALPLAGKGGALGLLIAIYTARPATPGVEGEEKRRFSEREEKILAGISNQVSIAIEQTRLYKESLDRAMELSHKIETIQVMNEIDRSILSTLEPHEILEIAVRTATRLAPCDGASVLLAEREKGRFLYAARFGLPSEAGEVIPFDDTLASEVLKTGRPQYIADLRGVAEGSEAPLPALEEGLLERGLLSHIRLPLVVKEEVIGILTVEARTVSVFTPENLSTLEKIAYHIGVALQNARQLKNLEDLFIGTVKSLSSAIDAKSSWTLGHSERVTHYAIQIAERMGLSEADKENLRLAGLLHDIGKIGIYEAVLEKSGRLTPEEFELVKPHSMKGVEILRPVGQLEAVLSPIAHHHENFDGSGYPSGLKGEEIPKLARILSVADAFDSMIADRPYRRALGIDHAVVELRRCSGTQFDPEVVATFLDVLERLRRAA